MNDLQVEVDGGIDAHADIHHVAVIDVAGRRLGDVQVSATAASYRSVVQFLDWCP